MKKSKFQHRNRGHKGISNGNFRTEKYNNQNYKLNKWAQLQNGGGRGNGLVNLKIDYKNYPI